MAEPGALSGAPGGASVDAGAPVLTFEVAFGGERHLVHLAPTCLIADLKGELFSRLSVSIAGQKLMGLPAGADSAPLSSLPIKRPVHKLILIGTRDAALAALAAAEAAAETAAEAAAEAAAAEEEEEADDANPAPGARDPLDISGDPRYLALIAKRVASYRPRVIEGLRAGKRLLVLDIDYTLIDHHTVASRPSDMERPYLHEFLARAYVHYDLVIWSATSMTWVATKMRELGCMRHLSYKLAALVCKNAMVTVEHAAYGLVDVKPLPVLWGLYPQAGHSARSTLMIDDLRRNFLLNPRSGLRIHACRHMPQIRQHDRELLHLAVYLEAIAAEPDLSALEHRDWRRLLHRRGYSQALEDEEERRRREGHGGGGGGGGAGS